MRTILAILLALALCSAAYAAPAGWICGPSGCRPAPKATPTIRNSRMVESPRFGSRLRAFCQKLKARVRGCR